MQFFVFLTVAVFICHCLICRLLTLLVIRSLVETLENDVHAEELELEKVFI